jgi:SAM-dependent methyltransferase
LWGGVSGGLTSGLDFWRSARQARQAQRAIADAWQRAGYDLSDAGVQELIRRGRYPVAGGSGLGLDDILPPNADRIIDIGSGGYDDYSLDMLVKLGRRYPNARVFGIDRLSDIGLAVKAIGIDRALGYFAPNLRGMVNNLPENVRFVIGDSSVVASNSADLVTFFAPEPSNLVKAAHELGRITRPGGSSVMVVRHDDAYNLQAAMSALGNATGRKLEVLTLSSSIFQDSFAATDSAGTVFVVKTQR